MVIMDGGENWYNTNSMVAVSRPCIVLLKECGLECYSLFSMDPLRTLETWNHGALYHFFCPCLWAGQFLFFCSIAPCLLSLKDFREICGTWLEYLFWKAISVGMIRSKMCEQSDMGFYWWRNVWRRWMLESKLELSISRHGKASTWGQMERGKWSVLKCHYSIRAQVLTKLNTTI